MNSIQFRSIQFNSGQLSAGKALLHDLIYLCSHLKALLAAHPSLIPNIPHGSLEEYPLTYTEEWGPRYTPK